METFNPGKWFWRNSTQANNFVRISLKMQVQAIKTEISSLKIYVPGLVLGAMSARAQVLIPQSFWMFFLNIEKI